ncbi:hypothetical protein [Nocardioides mesophilus]|uniref:PqqD family protein n=1 Tax=Nocardioides mesophilus TaxID=433659 RepID=A0A7G9R993_9ACTN|nr:hypothetical protein [Nocardioides mesophilus]QNN52168.1 hypothetical protein H9L09_16955 [Nocardioides mesophilus]
MTHDGGLQRGSFPARYRRADGVLWRDTGRHVVLLPRGEDRVPLVLGGGTAELWRLLDSRPTMTEIVAAFEPDPRVEVADEVECALHELVNHGVVEGDE